MASNIDTVRAAVLDHEAARQLAEYLRFHHLFSNISGFDLEWECCRDLLKSPPAMFETLAQQLAAFDEFLQTLESEL